MKNIDVFNGDADGICALHQLRLANPCESMLVTGVKRDIALLGRVQAEAGDQVTVLDVSLDKNRDDLTRILACGAAVFYCDHHFAGALPDSDSLQVLIDTDATVCTSLLMNAHLEGAHRAWAAVGAFGDNLFDAAKAAVASMALTAEQLDQLAHLGTLLNYNGYGVTLEDLHFHPEQLYRSLSAYEDPFAFMAESADFRTLDRGYADDMEKARALPFALAEDAVAVVMLPDEAWTRRVSGVYGNELARDFPQRAHALATVLPGGGYRISVRAPITSREGADELCMQFPTGGGRKGAAGINQLPVSMFDDFVAAFRRMYS